MSTLYAHLQTQRRTFADRCTACGECFAVCPIAPWIGLGGEPPGRMTAGVRDLVAAGERSGEAIGWAASCTLCGVCSSRCPEGLEPTTMLHLAKAEVGLDGATPQGLFTLMSEGIRLLARLQLDDAEVRRLTSPFGWGTSPAEVVLYYGCNVLRTPDILLTAIDVLHRLGVRFGVLGGPANCCGIVHYRFGGDVDRAEKVEQATYERMASFAPERVLLWCSNCEMQFLETGLRERRKPPFPLEHYATFLADRVENMRHLLVNAVRKRAVLHAHAGPVDPSRDVRKVLEAVPGLELLDVEAPKQAWSYGCGIGSLGLVPAAQRAAHDEFLDAAENAGADLVVTLTHDGQMVLCEEEARRPFQIRNFVSVVGEAMGIGREDLYKRYTLAGGSDAIVSAAEKFLERNRLNRNLVRETVSEHLGWGKRI